MPNIGFQPAGIGSFLGTQVSEQLIPASAGIVPLNNADLVIGEVVPVVAQDLGQPFGVLVGPGVKRIVQDTVPLTAS